MTKSGAIIGLMILMLVLYMGIQITFLDFYNHYGLPFGRADVDNYMVDINRGIEFPNHIFVVGLTRLSSSLMNPSLFITFFIPLALTIALPLSVFVLALFMTKDWTMSFYSVMAYVFGTISLQAFGISAMWSQMFATIFIVWAYIFFETYIEKRIGTLRLISAIMAVMTFIAHAKSAAAFAIYGALRYIIMGRRQLAVILAATGVVAYAFLAENIFEYYPYTVDIWFVLTNFMHPFLWVLAGFFIMRNMKSADIRTMTLIAFCAFTFVISYFSVLWRPLLSALPFLVVFAVMEFFRLLRQAHPAVGVTLGVLLMIALIVFGFNLTRSSLYAMYEEMVPGKFNETRQMDSAYFKSMFSIRDDNMNNAQAIYSLHQNMNDSAIRELANNID